MHQLNRDPGSAAKIRSYFGANLSHLIAQSGNTHAEICKLLSIHRTQLNRFIESQSFPRPDVLAAICDLFNVDARILMTDFDSYKALGSPALPSEIIGRPRPASQTDFPDGFYQEWRPLLPCEYDYACNLLFVRTVNGARITGLYQTPCYVKPDGVIECCGDRFRISGVAIDQPGGVLILDNQYDANHYTITALQRGSYGSPEYFPGHKKSVSAIVDGRRLMKSATVLKYLGADHATAQMFRREPTFYKRSETPESIKLILDDMEKIYELG